MPPSNFTKNHLDNEEHHSSGFPYDLLLLIIPIGFLAMFALYMCICQKIHNFRNPPIRINRSDSDFSINSRYSISTEYYQSDYNYIHNDLLQKPEEIIITDENNNEYKNKCCSICLEEYENENKILKYPCGHIFHDNCIDTWINTEVDMKITPSCPNCRNPISNQ